MNALEERELYGDYLQFIDDKGFHWQFSYQDLISAYEYAIPNSIRIMEQIYLLVTTLRTR